MFYIDGQLLDFSVIELLQLLQKASIGGGDKIDSDSLPSEPAGPANPVDIQRLVLGDLVVDHKVDLLHVDSAGEEVRADEDPGGPGSELLHHEAPFLVAHVALHLRDNEVLSFEVIG